MKTIVRAVMRAALILGTAVLAATGLASAQTGSEPGQPAPTPTQTSVATDSLSQPAPAVSADSLSGAATIPAGGATATPQTTPTPTTPPQTAPPPTTPTQTAPTAQTQTQTTMTPVPQQAKPRGPFDKGTKRLSFTGGWGRSFGEDYLLLGGGLGYFIRNGIELGFDLESWLLGDPGVTKLTPQLRLVKQLPRGRTPYLGAFWRRTLVEDLEDLSSLGGRAGIYSRVTARSAYGVGVVYERYLDCDDTIYNSCSQVYPEIVFGVSF